jgi:N utilization substance protein A
MKSDLIMAVNLICAEKDLPRPVILGAIEEALAHAYKRNYATSTANVQVQIDGDTGEVRVRCEKRVVEAVEDASLEIDLAAARKMDAQAQLGASVMIERIPTDFGRIAAQTAKQVILQRIHEAERDQLYEHFHQREGELITGAVQAIDYRNNQVTITLSKKVEGVLAAEDQLSNERYRIGQTVRSLLVEVGKGTRGPAIRLSRTHRNMLRRLMEREIPEIFSGTVEIKSVAREPGQRSKVAVAATQPGVDPVGSCVGMKGTRIQNIVDELSGEKIDVVEWHADVRQFISNALSPARPSETVLLEEGDARTAIVIVPDRQLSLAIGKEGQNARLAAKLTGWRIDIKSETEAATEGINEIKRQQMQILKARSLESRAPAAPGDDLLSRAEWLLRERDKTAVTLEQAAKMLVSSETAASQEASRAEPAAAQVQEAAAAPPEAQPTAEAAPATEVTSAPQPEPAAEAEPAPISMETLGPENYFIPDEPEDVESEERGKTVGRKAAKGKKTRKGHTMVFDEVTGEMRVVKKHKRQQGWEADIE